MFVWDNKNYEGNQHLIELGGIPVSDEGKRIHNNSETHSDEKQIVAEQLNLFDYMNKNN